MCVNETLDVAKPIHLHPIVQTCMIEDRASELPRTPTTPAWAHSCTTCKGLKRKEREYGREKDKETDLIGE